MKKHKRYLEPVGFDPFKPNSFRGFPLRPLDGDFNRLMRETAAPHVDYFETPKEIVMTAELPGVKKEDISLKVTETGLTLKVQQKEKHERETKENGRYEYAYSSRFQGYSRFIPFSKPVLANKAKATCKNGVLEVRAPKAHPDAKKEREVKIE